MTDAEQTNDKGPFGSIAVFLVGGFLGLLALVYLTTLMKKPPQGPIQELPHAVVMLEVPDLDQEVNRKALVKLQKDLEALGLAVQGPNSFSILVPDGDLPSPRTLEAISQEEWERAKPWLHAGSWLVPRVFSPDLKAAVIRLAPKDRGPFPSGMATRIQEVAKNNEHAGPISVYSRALGLEDEEARSKINVAFGVQTANVRLIADEEGALWKPEVQKDLQSSLPLSSARVRSATVFMNFALYVTGVMTQIDNPSADQVDWHKVRMVDQFAGGSGLISDNGKLAWVEVTTDAEGEGNLEVTRLVASSLPSIPHVKIDVPRKRPQSN